LRAMRKHALLSALSTLLLACNQRPAPEPAVEARGSAREPTQIALASEKQAAPSQPSSQPPTYVGSNTCASCHALQAKQWQRSHHDLAMQEPTEASVLGDFAGKRFSAGGETFTFRKQGDAYWVDVVQQGKKSSFPVRYVFGVAPLQQLLLDVGKGHLQALSVAWDAREKAQGGQRWFHLHPQEQVTKGDPLHWQGAQFNWNNMCADCHSTGVDKGYVRHTQSYETRFAEIDVSCEACHGPSSRHVEAARAKQPARDVAGFRGLKARERRWAFADGVAIAQLTGERNEQEQESCAPCHSRRAELAPAGADYHDRFRLALVEEPLYFRDGQVDDEVFELGSFLQSRMHAAGVTCSDCHEPHSLALRAEGNALCAQCHKSEVYDVPKHHFHTAGTPGAECVACHMPERTFMVIDARREHRFAVPRPDLSARVHSPDPCTSCHRDKSSEWAAGELSQRKHLRKGAHFSEALQLAHEQAPAAAAALARTFAEQSLPAIVRAALLTALAERPGPELVAAATTALGDSSPLVRRALAEALPRLPNAPRLAAAATLLGDRHRSVRMAVAQSLAGTDASGLPAAARGLLQTALREFVRSLEYRADRADGLTGLASLRLAGGDTAAALALLNEALARDPTFTAAYVNTADVLRALGREAEAETITRAGLRSAADKAPLFHALGLAQIRARHTKEALANLARAHHARPEVSRYTFVYAVALFDSGQQAESRKILREALVRAPGDQTLRTLLADYERR
jgi:predicted CXXCH cytochrome family protein